MNATETNKKRICFYLRNSTNKGQQDYKFQREALQSVLDSRSDVVLTHEYAEQVSGTLEEIKDRPEMFKLMQAVENKEFDELWAYDLKRVARNAIVLLTICRDCTKNNVNVSFMQDGYNTLLPNGKENPTVKMMLGFLGEMAYADRQSFIQKGVDGKQTKTRAGNYTGGNLPTGYTYINKLKSKKIVIDESQKKVVDYIFDQIGNKKQTCNATAINLNNLKLIDPDFETVMKSKNYGSKNNKWLFHSWAGGTVKAIINCTWYIKGSGYRIYNNERIELDDSLTFIDADLWDRANEQLKKNQFVKTKTKHTYLIKDLLYCSCGQRMYPQNSAVRFHYKCKLNIQNDRDKSISCTTSSTIGVEQLENTLFLLIKNKLPEFRLTVQKRENKEEQINQKIQENKSIIDVISDNNISKLTEQRKRILTLFEKFGGDGVELENKILAVDNDIKQEKKKISELESENKQLAISLTELDMVTEIENNINMIQNDKNLIRYYFERLIKKVTVCGGLKRQLVNVVKIDWSENVNNNNSTYLLYHSKVNHNPLYYFISPTQNNYIEWNPENKTFDIAESNETVNVSIEEISSMLDSHYWEFAEQLYPWKMLENFPLVREHKDLLSTEKFNIPVKPESLGIDLNTVDYEQHKNYNQYNRLLTLVNSGQVNYKFYLNMGVGKLEIVTPFE
jgi:DNA invertase Pin-like site-specific DNA recombinase